MKQEALNHGKASHEATSCVVYIMQDAWVSWRLALVIISPRAFLPQPLAESEGAPFYESRRCLCPALTHNHAIYNLVIKAYSIDLILFYNGVKFQCQTITSAARAPD